MLLIISLLKQIRNRIVDFPNLWGYARDLYQTPGFGDTTDFEAIKKGYFASANVIDNPIENCTKGTGCFWMEYAS